MILINKNSNIWKKKTVSRKANIFLISESGHLKNPLTAYLGLGKLKQQRPKIDHLDECVIVLTDNEIFVLV